MFEVLLDQPRVRRLKVSPESEARILETERAVLLSSGLVWGEHCTECAWPTCYSQCSLYTPRADLNCRRFDDGIAPVDVELSTGRAMTAMRIAFRQWGKLEAHTQVRLATMAHLRRTEHADRSARNVLRSELLPYAARRRTGQWWSKVQDRSLAAGIELTSDDAFVIEVISEGLDDVPVTLTILGESSDGRFFQHGCTLRAGYNRSVISVAAIAAKVDLGRPVFVRIEPTAAVRGNSLVFTLVDFVRLSAPLEDHGGDPKAASPSTKVKCVVWDLDNTVWRGTLVEDGPDALEVRPEVREVIKALDARGVLQSVASKNDFDEAHRVLEAAGLAEYMLHPQISWDPKGQAIRRIASALNIGLDTLLFVDDQPFERAEVLSHNPQLRVADATEVAELLARDDLDVPVTAESRRRREMYREEAGRQEALQEAPDDFDEFLRSCRVTLTLSAPSADNAERIYELSQRTNQLNYSGERLTRDAVDRLSRGEGPTRGVVLSASDRFGDYGIVGFVTIDEATFTVTNFFMSCRVQRKRVENAFFARLLMAGREQGHSDLRIRHKATARNRPAVEVLQALGARPVEWPAEGTDGSDEVLYTLSCAVELEGWDIVAVHDEVLVA